MQSLNEKKPGQTMPDDPRARRTAAKKRKRRLFAGIAILSLFLFGVLAVRLYLDKTGAGPKPGRVLMTDEGKIPRPELDVSLLTVNEYSRPAIALEQVKGIVIHYTANPGTGAMANRNYFENLKDTHSTKASSHFIVGLEGEIVQCIPSSEIAYASNARNIDTLSIECCIEDETGKFNQATYDAVIHLTAWLVEHFGLETSDVIRHYDVTGKACPKYFVEFPSAWDGFLADVQGYLKKYGVL